MDAILGQIGSSDSPLVRMASDRHSEPSLLTWLRCWLLVGGLFAPVVRARALPAYKRDNTAIRSLDLEERLRFVHDLEECIRRHARRLAETFPSWGNKCGPVTAKVDFQAALYEETLAPIFSKVASTAGLEPSRPHRGRQLPGCECASTR